MNNKIIITFIILSIINLISINQAELYDNNDQVINVDQTNFAKVIFRQNNIFIINFYLSWCGHCQRFSNKWKELGENIKNWKSIVKLSGIDCQDQQNLDICNKYNLVKFPAIIAVPFNATSFDQFKNLTGLITNQDGGNVIDLRHAIVDYISEVSPNLISSKVSSYVVDDKSTARGFKNSLTYKQNEYVLILNEELENSYFGKEILLELSEYWDPFKIVKVIDEHRVLIKSYNIELPAIVQYKDDEEFQSIINANDVSSKDEDILRMEFAKKLKIIFIGVISKPLIAKTGLYMVEIYKTLKYSFENEVASHRNLSVEQVKILHRFMVIVNKYLPIDNENVRRFFKRMIKWISTKNHPVNMTNFVASMKISDGYLPNVTQWRHCRGSDARYRGYPCGLWLLFHTLTVGEYLNFKLNSSSNKSESHTLTVGEYSNLKLDSSSNKSEVLPVIRDYIHEFFSCRQCASEFYRQAKNIEHNLTLTLPQNSILWLWRAHNQINMRLKGDITEDPQYPKDRFPPPSLCPTCLDDNNQYDENRVLNFLVQYYSHFEKNSASHIKTPTPTTGQIFTFASILLFYMLYSNLLIISPFYL